MIRAFCICSLIALVTASIGCKRSISPGLDIEHATQVTFDQLKEVTQGQSFFGYTGSDDDFHYFKVQNGFYRLSSEFEMPQFHRQIDEKWKIGSFLVHVTVNEEKIIIHSGGVGEDNTFIHQ